MGQTELVEKSGFTMSNSNCRHQFGFLSQRPKGVVIPEECFTCEKMLDCTVARAENSGPTIEIVEVEPEVAEGQKQNPRTVHEEAKEDVTEEIDEPAGETPNPEPGQIAVVEEVDAEGMVEDEPETIIEEPPKLVAEQLKKIIGHIRKLRVPKFGLKSESEEVSEKKGKSTSDYNFQVESPGTLYNQWSGTVLISKDILESWGKKVKEVELLTKKGRITICKAHPAQNQAPNVIQVPSKIKASLRIEDGACVKVKPIEK